MTENDVQLLTRMATDLAMIATGYAELHATCTTLATQVQALQQGEAAPADTSSIADILAKLEASAPTVSQTAANAQQTAATVSAAATGAASADTPQPAADPAAPAATAAVPAASAATDQTGAQQPSAAA